MKRLEIDTTTSVAMLARIWQTLASPLTLVLIIFCFSDQERGLYWLIWSTLGIQVFAELGFQWVILNVASHEWSNLSLNDRGIPQGDVRSLGRLASLARLVVSWYAIASIVIMPAIWFVGFSVFSSKPTTVPWILPWTVLTVLAGLSLTISACVSVLEGCNQVPVIQRIRLLQAITGSLVVWSLILMGGGLWVAVAATAVQLVWEVFLVAVLYRQFWWSILGMQADVENRISWKQEIWPLQWNIALQSISHYLAYQTIVLVMQRHSLELASQMGTTWQVLNASLLIAATWLQVRAPFLGMLVAQKRFAELNGLFRRLVLVSSVTLCGVLGLFAVFVTTAGAFPGKMAERVSGAFLPGVTITIFCIGVALVHVQRCLNLYLRAHKRDPMLWSNVGCNLLLGALILFWGTQYGALAAACAFSSTIACLHLPLSWYVWRTSRRQWQTTVENV